jgi:hypothetical protein
MPWPSHRLITTSGQEPNFVANCQRKVSIATKS